MPAFAAIGAEIRSKRWRAPRACTSAPRSARAGSTMRNYLDLIRAQCGILVPENELKMPALQAKPGTWDFARADRLLEFAAEQRPQGMRGHCLLWHHPRWLPRWLDGYDFGSEPARRRRSAAARTHRDHLQGVRQAHRLLGRGQRSRRQRHRRHARDRAVEGDRLARPGARDRLPRGARRSAEHRAGLQRLHGLGGGQRAASRRRAAPAGALSQERRARQCARHPGAHRRRQPGQQRQSRLRCARRDAPGANSSRK